MPLYYFDLRSADGLFPDEEGTELSSMDDVQNEAAYALTVRNRKRIGDAIIAAAALAAK